MASDSQGGTEVAAADRSAVLGKAATLRKGSTLELREAVKDVVDLAVDGVLQRIRWRTRALEDGPPERIYAQEEG